MNIKSLILGSAAALFAAGSAQAADLPVAEPVDYVRICNAYGAGYHFIPGTDTCLKISGYVRAEFNYREPVFDADLDRRTRDEYVTKIGARANLIFTAKEETELGTLVGYMRYDTADNGFDKYYLSLGGLYAGITDSAASIEYDNGFYGNTLFASSDVGAMGYNMALGNGFSAHIAIENQKRIGSSSLYAGQAMPDMVAALRISQGWGSAALTGVVSQVRYMNALIDTDYGYAIGAGVKINLDMLSEGSSFGISAGYSSGALRYIGGASSSTSVLGLTGIVSDADITGVNTAKLNSAYNVFASLKYVWTDTFYTALEGGYMAYNDRNNMHDAKYWNVGLTAAYKPVKNFKAEVGVGYEKTDFDKAYNRSYYKDVDGWVAKLRLQRDF